MKTLAHEPSQCEMCITDDCLNCDDQHVIPSTLPIINTVLHPGVCVSIRVCVSVTERSTVYKIERDGESEPNGEKEEREGEII